MISTKDKIEKMYRVPCGPMDISADGVCRRSLKDSLNDLLDRLTLEVNPNSPSKKIPKGAEVSEDGKSFTIAEPFKEQESRKRDLQGNSKLLQDSTGKMSGWRDEP